MKNEEKAVGIGLQVRDCCISRGVNKDNSETASMLAQGAALEMAKWKDKQFKEREEGLRGTINAIEATLQKANESGMYYFNKCNLLKCKLEEQQANYEELKKRYDEAVEREKIARKIIDNKNNELNELRE